MSSKEKLALGATVAVAVGVAAYAYTQSRRVYSDDKDSTEKDNKIKEENYPVRGRMLILKINPKMKQLMMRARKNKKPWGHLMLKRSKVHQLPKMR